MEHLQESKEEHLQFSNMFIKNFPSNKQPSRFLNKLLTINLDEF